MLNCYLIYWQRHYSRNETQFMKRASVLIFNLSYETL